jgi:hypothetical protein
MTVDDLFSSLRFFGNFCRTNNYNIKISVIYTRHIYHFTFIASDLSDIILALALAEYDICILGFWSWRRSYLGKGGGNLGTKSKKEAKGARRARFVH